jgi:hypothetical protein
MKKTDIKNLVSLLGMRSVFVSQPPGRDTVLQCLLATARTHKIFDIWFFHQIASSESIIDTLYAMSH